MNILIKLTCLVGLVIAPLLAEYWQVEIRSDRGASAASADAAMIAEDTPVSAVFAVSPDNTTFKWMGTKVTGRHYGNVTGEGELTLEANLITHAKVMVHMGSLTVEDVKDEESNAKLTNHLKSEDFFDVDTYSESYVIIEKSTENGSGGYSFKGTMILKGIEGPVQGTYKVGRDDDGSVMVAGEFNFDRTDYDVRYRSGRFFDDLGDRMINDEVNISFRMIG